jgi:hypothetical protein
MVMENIPSFFLKLTDQQCLEICGNSRTFVSPDEDERYCKALKCSITREVGRNTYSEDGLTFKYGRPLRENRSVTAMIHRTCDDKKSVPLIAIWGSEPRLCGEYIIDNITDTHLEMKLCKYPRDMNMKTDGNQLLYEGNTFRSLLEQKFYKFLNNLGVKSLYEYAMFRLSDQTIYTPDFLIFDFQIEDITYPQVYVELKPTFPTQDELEKCEELSKYQTVVLCYGNPEILPRAYSDDNNYDNRRHHHGLRAIFFKYGVVQLYELVFMVTDGRVVLAQVKSSCDRRWCDPLIVNAAKQAT